MAPDRRYIVDTCEHDGEVGRCPMCRARDEREAERAAERPDPAWTFDPRAAAAGDADG